MGARVRGFGGETPALPQGELVIGEGILGGLPPDLGIQHQKSRLIMDDLKEIIKAAVFEVLEEVFGK